MKIATWNLDHASNSKRQISSQIERMMQIDADIWVLTETTDKVDLQSNGYFWATPHFKNSYNKYWSTIWSKWPITQQIECYDNETAVCAQIETPSGALIVYGTIITWMNDKGKDNKSPAWSEHEKSIVDHGADWMAIQGRHTDVPFIVMGDFNQTRDGAKRGYCSPKGIQLLDEQLRLNNLTCITDEDFGAQGKLKPDPKNKNLYRHNVDHICISKTGIEIRNVGVWNHFHDEMYWSDHNGVYAEISLL